MKQNVTTSKLKIINENAAKANSNRHSYWKLLRKLNRPTDYSMRITAPKDPDCIIDDPVIIKEKITNYWAKVINLPSHDDQISLYKLGKR